MRRGLPLQSGLSKCITVGTQERVLTQPIFKFGSMCLHISPSLFKLMPFSQCFSASANHLQFVPGGLYCSTAFVPYLALFLGNEIALVRFRDQSNRPMAAFLFRDGLKASSSQNPSANQSFIRFYPSRWGFWLPSGRLL